MFAHHEAEWHLGTLDAPDQFPPTYENWTVRREAALSLFMRALALWVLIAVSPGAAEAATKSPDLLTDRFIAAWNTHDLAAFDALYAEAAVWVPVAEERTEGRKAIVAEFAKVHKRSGWAVKTTIAKKDVPEVHFLRPDVATVFFHMDFMQDGHPIAGLQRALLLVAVRHAGDWKIAAGQLTKKSSSPPG